jgi:hypothetical protein
MANALGGASGALSGAAAGSALGPLGTIGGGIIGGLAGLFSGGDDNSEEMRKQALQYLENLGEAPDLSNPVHLQAFQQAGLLTPELIEKLPLNADQKNELIENTENKKEQQYAANALKELSQTGLSAEDRAAYNKLRNQTASNTQAKLKQIEQEQQMRGQSSAGNTLAAQLSAVQSAQQNESEQADRIAAQASEARRSALGQFANLAGEMRGTELEKQRYNMENELERQKFLDQNSISRQQANVAAQNAANVANLERQQGTSDRNVTMQNQELYRQQDAKRQAWLDNLNAAQAKANVLTNNANAESQRAANQAASTQNMVTAGLGGLTTLGKNNFGGMFSSGTGIGSSGTPQSDALNSFKFDSSKTMNASRTGFAHGGVVPGEKKFSWDTILDDTVDASLSPGEIVIPESHAKDPKLAKAYIDYLHNGPTPSKGEKKK